VTSESFSESLEKIKPFFPEIAENFKELAERLQTLEGYMDKLRDVINLPPVFPVNPENEQYFRDDKTGDQFVFHEAEDEWDDNYWWDIKSFNKVRI
jgi:hypothetical protein